MFIRELKLHYPCSKIYGSKIIMKPIYNKDVIKIKYVMFYKINKTKSIGKHDREFPINSCNYRVTHWGSNGKGLYQNIDKYIKFLRYQRSNEIKSSTGSSKA